MPEPSRARLRSRLSLAWQLTCWFSLSAFVLVGLAALMLYGLLVQHFREADRGYLLDKIAVLRSEFASSPDREVWLKQAALTDPAARSHTRLLLRLMSRGHQTLIATPEFKTVLGPGADPSPGPLEQGATPTVRSLRAADGTHFLLGTATVQMDENVIGILQVAYNNPDEDRILQQYRRSLLFVLAITSTVCLLVGWQISRRGLRPVHRLTEATRLIGSQSLHVRLEERDLPSDLVELSHAFNQMLDRLEHSFARLAGFSADIAHELRTPINNLQGLAEVTLASERDGSEYREAIASGLEECERIAHLIDTLLFLARADNPQTQLHREPLQISAEFSILVNFYQIPATEAGIILSSSCSPDIHVAADRALLHRALGNLLDNALAHTPAGGRITLSAEVRDGLVHLCVADTGRGIAPEHLPHLFDRSRRRSQARDTGHHLGLGLAIVRGTARLHGGDIAIRSQLGVGTWVDVTFPLHRPLPADGPETTSSRAGGACSTSDLDMLTDASAGADQGIT